MWARGGALKEGRLIWISRKRGEGEVGVAIEKGGIEDEAGAVTGTGIGGIDIVTVKETNLGIIGAMALSRDPETDVRDIGHEALIGEGKMTDIQSRIEEGAIHLEVGENAVEKGVLRGEDKRRQSRVLSITAYLENEPFSWRRQKQDTLLQLCSILRPHQA